MGKKKSAKSTPPKKSKRARSPQETEELLHEIASLVREYGDKLDGFAEYVGGIQDDEVTVLTGNCFSALDRIREWFNTQILLKFQDFSDLKKMEVGAVIFTEIKHLQVVSNELEEKCGGRN